jgi:hypothetical protein
MDTCGKFSSYAMAILLHLNVELFRGNGMCRAILEVKFSSWNDHEIVV